MVTKSIVCQTIVRSTKQSSSCSLTFRKRASLSVSGQGDPTVRRRFIVLSDADRYGNKSSSCYGHEDLRSMAVFCPTAGTDERSPRGLVRYSHILALEKHSPNHRAGWPPPRPSAVLAYAFSHLYFPHPLIEPTKCWRLIGGFHRGSHRDFESSVAWCL